MSTAAAMKKMRTEAMKENPGNTTADEHGCTQLYS